MRRCRYLLLLLCTVWAAGCTQGGAGGVAAPTATALPPAPSPAPTATLAAAADQRPLIDAAERLWRQQPIDSYTIEVHYFTFGSEIFVRLVVADGAVAECSCRAGGMFDPADESQCERFFAEPERYTVAGLFSAARAMNDAFIEQTGGGADAAGDAPNLAFDRSAGYPTRIVWRLPEYTEWCVTSFTPSSGRPADLSPADCTLSSGRGGAP